MGSSSNASSDHAVVDVSPHASNDDLGNVEAQEPPSSWTRFILAFGLPAIISVAAIDPGNLEVDLQAGHAAGYTLIWTILFSSVVGFVLQSLAAHVTISSGSHLADLIARTYKGDKVLWWSIFGMAELSIIAFDVAEVVGTAFALQILFNWPLWVGMIMSVIDTMLVLYLQRRGLNKVEIIIEGLLFILAACIGFEFFLSRPSFGSIVEGTLIPGLGSKPSEGAIIAVGILGSVIMAHNLFLHSWLIHDREERRQETAFAANTDQAPIFREHPSREGMLATSRYATIETAAIFFATFLVNMGVLCVTAAMPKSALDPGAEISLKDAGAMLQDVLGSRFASTAWAIALLASGHAATVTGALASQAVCEGFFSIREGRSPQIIVLATRAVAIFPALAGALLAGEAGADRLIVLTQVVLSLALPFAAVPMLKILSHLKENSRCGVASPFLLGSGYAAFILLLGANVYALYDLVQQIMSGYGYLVANAVAVLGLGAFVLLGKLIVAPVQFAEVSVSDSSKNTGYETKPLLPERDDQNA